MLVRDGNNSVRCISQALFAQVILVLLSFGFLVDLSTPALPSFWASNTEISNNTTTIGRIVLEVPTFPCATILPAVFLLNEFIGLKATIWVGAVARLAALATSVLAETLEIAELGCALSGLSQATKVPFYCYIFRLLTKELHLNLFGLLCIWTLLGNAVSCIVLHFVSADVDLYFSTYFSIVPTLAACLLEAVLVPFGNGFYAAFVAMWPGYDRPENGSSCARLYWTKLASEILSSIRAMLFSWTIWCAITAGVLYGLTANLAHFLAQSVHPSHSYGLVSTIAVLLAATITIIPNLFEPVAHYPVWLSAFAPLIAASMSCEILSDNDFGYANTCLMYILYACVTFATSTIVLLCIAVKINTDVFRMLFGLVMFASLALQSVAEFVQKERLIDADGILYIYLVAQFLLVIAAFTIRCLTGSYRIEQAPDEESPVEADSPYASPRSISSLVP